MNNKKIGKLAVTGIITMQESASSDYFIAVNKYHPTQTKRFRKIP